MPCCEISDCAQISKTIIAVRHFGLGGRESLETAVKIFIKISKFSAILHRERHRQTRVLEQNIQHATFSDPALNTIGRLFRRNIVHFH